MSFAYIFTKSILKIMLRECFIHISSFLTLDGLRSNCMRSLYSSRIIYDLIKSMSTFFVVIKPSSEMRDNYI